MTRTTTGALLSTMGSAIFQRIPISVLGLVAAISAGVAGWRVQAMLDRPDATPSTPPPAAAAGIFVDVTGPSGLHFEHDNGAAGRFWIPEEMGAGACLFDADGDHDLDALLLQGGPLDGPAGGGSGNRLFINDGRGRFTDATAASGAGLGGYTLGCAAGDIDNDGDIDVYLARLGPDALLLNDGSGRFTDASNDAGITNPGFGTSVALFDYDGDGWLDIYVANYIDWSRHHEQPCFDPAGARDYCGPVDYGLPARDTLWHNLGDGRFEDASAISGIASAPGHSLGVLAFDADGDFDLDLYVATDQTPAALWINGGDGTFTNEATLRGCAFNHDGMAIAGMGVAGEDLDGDGDVDLMVTNIEHQAHLCLRNDDGFFEDVSHAWGCGGWSVPFTGFGIALFDQDHDGSFDAMIANGAVNRRQTPYFEGHDYAEPNQFIRQAAPPAFADATASAGAVLRHPGTSRAAVSGDIDNDGDIDVLMTNNGGPAQLLRNDGAAGAWISLDVRETSGRHAIGARVTATAGGRTLRRQVNPYVGYLGSNDPRVHIGLGQAEAVDELIVTWLDGTTTTWTALPARSFVTVQRGTTAWRRTEGPGGA